MRQLNALRRTGRAGRVDQRRNVVGRDRAPARLEVEGRIASGDQLVQVRGSGLGALYDEHVFELRHLLPHGQHTVEELTLGDDQVSVRGRTTYSICSGDEVL